MKKKKIVGAALGTCVHISGLYHFLKLAEDEGFSTVFSGPAVPVDRLLMTIKKEKPDMVALSYRLTPEVAESLFMDLSQLIEKEKEYKSVRFIFGGTPPVCETARKFKIFKKIFDGSESVQDIRNYLKNSTGYSVSENYPQTLIERIHDKYPYPLLRHHYGRPTMDETHAGIKQIAISGVLDIISLGPDQNAQEFFFHPEKMNVLHNGAGGVPIRTANDMADLYNSSRYGNFPLMRCYAGTRDLLKWAEMSVKTIRNAWGAIPLCWYSTLDGRSTRTIQEAITEHQLVIKWYADQGIPVEVNESHQWSLRDAHDALAVAMAYLAAYNAKKMGVRHYIMQFMFNTPSGTTPVMDVAKMLAKKELIEELEDDTFTMYRMVRAGLTHFSSSPFIAKGQLASSALISMVMKPHIFHVVGFSEGDHAVRADELIESCSIIHGVLRNSLIGLPDMTIDPRVIQRKEILKREVATILNAISILGKGSPDPFSDPAVIERSILEGLLDTPHFAGLKSAKGKIMTGMIDGGCDAVNPKTGKPIREEKRLSKILEQIK